MTERARTQKRRRPHPAAGSRAAATGLGLVALFGITAGMGVANRAEQPTAPASASIVQAGAPTLDTSPSPSNSVTTRPRTRVAAPKAKTPTARTHGSR